MADLAEGFCAKFAEAEALIAQFERGLSPYTNRELALAVFGLAYQALPMSLATQGESALRNSDI